MPSENQIYNLRHNSLNMIDFINHLHDYFQDVVNDVFSRISAETNNDAGQKWVSFVYGLTMSAFADVELKGSDTFASFMSTFLSSYDNNTPSNEGLNKTISDVWERLSKTFLQANDDLTAIAMNPESYWDTSYWSETLNKTFYLRDMANDIFPAKDDIANKGPIVFSTGTDILIEKFRYSLTRYALGKKWSILHDPTKLFWDNANDAELLDFAKKITKSNQEIFFLWKPDESGSCASCPTHGLSSYEPRLGVGDWYSNWDYYHGATPTKDMLEWLIKDDGYGTILNPDALATRYEVFYEWGLSGSLSEKPQAILKKEKIIPSYDDKEKSLEWFKLFKEKGRRNIEETIIEKAYSDANFYRNLIKNPKKTIEEELGIEFPEKANIKVISENVGDYTLVLPAIGGPKKNFDNL